VEGRRDIYICGYRERVTETDRQTDRQTDRDRLKCQYKARQARPGVSVTQCRETYGPVRVTGTLETVVASCNRDYENHVPTAPQHRGQRTEKRTNR